MADNMKILDGTVRVRSEHVPDDYPKAKIKDDKRNRTPGAASGAEVSAALAKAAAPAADTSELTSERDAAVQRAEAAEAELAALKAANSSK